MVTEVNTYHVSLAEMREARRDAYAATASCLLGEEMSIEIPAFHYAIWNELMQLKALINMTKIGHVQKLLTVPREHSKTTLVKLGIVNLLRESSLSFVLYASVTHGSSANALRDVVNWLLSPQEELLWGRAEQIKKNETDGLWILRIPLRDGSLKEVILKAVGVGQQVRGLNIYSKRPDLLVLDDIEDLDTADSGTQQKKIDEWLFGTVLKATAKKSLRIFIGNIIRETTLLARLCKDPAWNPTNYGCLIRNRTTGKLEPLWPGMHSVESLLTEYRSYRKLGLGHVWESEMMNLSRDLTLADSITNDCLVPDLSPEEVECGFICIDPAFGVNQVNDESALTVHVNTRKSKIPILCDSRTGRFKEDALFDVMMDLVYTWGIRTVCVEAIAAQRLIIPLFKAFMRERGIPEEVIFFLPLQGQRALDAKITRIKAFRSALQELSYGLCESQIDLKLTLEEWSPESSQHDDLIDSAALGQMVWKDMGKMIQTEGTRVIRIGELLQGFQSVSSGSGRSELQTASI